MLNAMSLDAMVYGNHEFDLGPEPLAAFVAEADFPVLSGNTDVSGDNRLAPDALTRVVLDFDGEKVAVVGVVTPETAEISSAGPTVRFSDPAAFVAAEVAALRAEGVDKIVVLSHLGTPADIALASTVAGIDAVVGGHTHTLFSNTDPDAPYKYPLMVDGPGGASVAIVQAGAYSKYLGHLALTWDATGAVTAATGDTILLDASVTPDPAILARVAELGGPIAELKSKVVAHVPADIDGSRETCRTQECPMGDLVADAMLERVKDQGVTIALQNGGGLRASIGAGEVSMGDVLAVLPFQNTLSTFNIPGSAIVSALENGVSQVEEGGGRFPQVAGLRFTWDPTVPPMEGRIRSVEVREGEAWVPIDPAKIYLAATNNFMRNGGDGYVSLRDGSRNAYDFGPGLEGVLADYLSAHPDYEPATDGRITRLE
jgi:5'-nucleotidase